MKCPLCQTKFHEVIDSRKRGNEIRRRRQCFNGHRFSTLETLAELSSIRRIPRGQNKYPQELVDKCFASRDAGNSHQTISDKFGIPLDTIRDWMSRGTRSPSTQGVKK